MKKCKTHHTDNSGFCRKCGEMVNIDFAMSSLGLTYQQVLDQFVYPRKKKLKRKR